MYAAILKQTSLPVSLGNKQTSFSKEAIALYRGVPVCGWKPLGDPGK